VEEARNRDAEECRRFECPVRRIADAHDEVMARVASAFPEDVWRHALNARREALLAVKALIDCALEAQERLEGRMAKRRDVDREEIEVE